MLLQGGWNPLYYVTWALSWCRHGYSEQRIARDNVNTGGRLRGSTSDFTVVSSTPTLLATTPNILAADGVRGWHRL